MKKFATLMMICALSAVAMADTTISIPDSFAGVFQTQANTNGIVNAVTLEHGTSASNTVTLMVDDAQHVEDDCYVVADQGIVTDLWQVSNTCADCGIVATSQELGNAATQWQLVGNSVGIKAQGQTLALEGLQTVTKTEGTGSASVLQTGITSQDQYAANAAGFASESADVTAIQMSNVTGEPGTTAAVGSAVSTTTSQTQYVY